MKRNVALAGAVLMMTAWVARAETPPVHNGGSQPSTPVVRPSEESKQAKLFQLVNACLAERPGAPSAADEILRRFRSPGAIGVGN